LAGADAKAAFEKDGLLDELKKALAERALNAEIGPRGRRDGRPGMAGSYSQLGLLAEQRGDPNAALDWTCVFSDDLGHFVVSCTLP
jgi:hypothetical protein